jgi:hypothetical protein
MAKLQKKTRTKQFICAKKKDCRVRDEPDSLYSYQVNLVSI